MTAPAACTIDRRLSRGRSAFRLGDRSVFPMSMSVGGVGGPVPVASSQAASGSSSVQAEAAVSVQKKSQDLNAELTTQLIASATGVGQRLDVKG
jgi:hypothetical protein